MADFGAPATPNYSAPDGLQTLGNLMGLRSKQLAIQGQQLGLQGQQQGLQKQAAEVQMTQQDALQRAAAAKFFQSFDLSKHIKDDGTLDLDSAMTSPELKATGDAAPAIVQHLVGIKNSQLAAKQSLTQLNAANLDQFREGVGGLSSDPDVVAGNNTGKGKVLDQMTAFAQTSPDAARIAKIYGPVLQNAPANKLSDVLKNIKLQAIAAGSQAEATKPSGPTFTNKKGEISVLNTNALASQPVGSQVGQSSAQGLTPTQQPSYIADSTSAAARAGGTASADIERGNQISSIIQQSKNAIPLTERIDQLSHEIASGNLAKHISESGKWLGFSSINEARSQLLKDLGQVKALATQSAGSDSRAATILEGYPTDTTPENTTHAAMDYIRGMFKQNLSRGKMLLKYQQNDPSLRGFQAADNMLTSTTDPLMHEFLSLKPEERAGFYKRNFSTPQQAQEFKHKVTAIQQHTKVFDEQ